MCALSADSGVRAGAACGVRDGAHGWLAGAHASPAVTPPSLRPCCRAIIFGTLLIPVAIGGVCLCMLDAASTRAYAAAPHDHYE
jgi:hypothetical protein